MGREANCTCRWGGQTANVKALLETSELILRGEIRKKVPFAEMREIAVAGDSLRFSFRDETVSLTVGGELAAKWEKAIKNPPSLTRKLGISSETIVHVVGSIEDEALKSALAEAGRISTTGATLIVASVDTPQSVEKALREAKDEVRAGAPIWFVYRKGPGQPLSESQIRSVLLPIGMVDTKVAGVSASLTAIRFNRRKG